MDRRKPNSLGREILARLKRGGKETARFEYKREIDISELNRKAEFVRDVISLANSEGEIPRKLGYFVIGYSNGEFFDVRPKKYEASIFGKIIDSCISPRMLYDYDEFPNGHHGYFGVLTIRASETTVYLATKDLKDPDGRLLLAAGQSWGRRADRKQALSGDDLQTRWKEITTRETAVSLKPLKQRIAKLEAESGPVFEVKRHRFALEQAKDWSERQDILERLFPYAREFDKSVQSEIMSAIYDVTCRTHSGMPPEVASVISGILDYMMPLAGGGMNRRASRRLKASERKLLRRIGDRAFELAWDSCRYLRDIAITRIAAQEYWKLIRFARLNGLEEELDHFLTEARRCQNICLESGVRKAFQAGYECMGEAIADALAIPQDDETPQEQHSKSSIRSGSSDRVN